MSFDFRTSPKIEVQEGGVTKLLSRVLNFIGATVTDVGGVATVTITGGGADPFVGILFNSNCDILFRKKLDGTIETMERC